MYSRALASEARVCPDALNLCKDTRLWEQCTTETRRMLPTYDIRDRIVIVTGAVTTVVTN